jgi:hypothetical protein
MLPGASPVILSGSEIELVDPVFATISLLEPGSKLILIDWAAAGSGENHSCKAKAEAHEE